MSEDFTLADLYKEGAIIDNRRLIGKRKVTLKDVLHKLATGSQGFKCAVGYFFIEGLSEIIHFLDQLKEIKILMGGETTPKTKKELILAFRKKFDELEINEITVPTIALFQQLVKQAKVLKVRVLFGEDGKFQRLHSKAYLFLKDVESRDIFERYKAGVIGSSNLTPAGLIGNTELNIIVDENIDLQYLERWFDELWGGGTEEFEKLRVTDALAQAIEHSKFRDYLAELYRYIDPEHFFKILIRFLNADYLFEDWTKSDLFRFQVVDTIRCLRLFKEIDYRGMFLTSSVGLGKSYVACKLAEIFIREGKQVLVIAPANLVKSEDLWPRYLNEFKIGKKVDMVSMGELQKNPVNFLEHQLNNYSTNERIKLDKQNKYGLIVIDEAHNYRNADAYRTRNLKQIIDLNGNAKLMFLTATPINTRLDDILNLIKLFHRPGSNLFFDKMVRNLEEVIKTVMKKEYEELTESEKKQLSDRQEEIERALFIKSTRETIKTSEEYVRELKELSGVDIREIPDPDVEETTYRLHQSYRPIVNGIVDFIRRLTAAHLRIIDPKKGVRLSGFFKWLLYKRFESSITAYYLTLKRLARKNELIESAIENRDASYLEEEYEDDIDINFTLDFKENIERVISKIERGEGKDHLDVLEDLWRDTELIKKELKKLEPYIKSDLLFENDFKLDNFFEILQKHKGKKILLFSQYKDTLKAIEAFLNGKIEPNTVRYVSSETENKGRIIETFNDMRTKLSFLITTDTLSEGFNIGGADIVINFDIPYNPVRIIQRIGRATRLDNPKKISVINFKPDVVIDKELELIEKMDMRIKDIIRFIGVEYRVWIDRENEIRDLLTKRRIKDVNLYLEVLDSIRSDLRSGKFGNLEVDIKYERPTLVLIQRAIKKFVIMRKDVEETAIPTGNHYTVLKGNRGLAVFYCQGEVYNENKLSDAKIESDKDIISLEKSFEKELSAFNEFLTNKKKEKVVLSYYTGLLDRMIHNILDIIESKKYSQLYSGIEKLEETLYSVRDSCGSTTERVIKRILKDIRKGSITNRKVNDWTKSLKDSFTKKGVQLTLTKEPTRQFAIALVGDQIT